MTMPRAAARFIAIDFCCNDPDNGEFAGRVAAADYSGVDLVYDYYGPGLKFTVSGRTIRIHRRVFPFSKRIFWIGNWCWDRFWFHRADGVRLLRTMRDSGKWQIEGGPVTLIRWFEPSEAA